MKYNVLILLLGCFIFSSAFYGCEKRAGDYSEYLGNAEGVYPGKPVSIAILQGINRADVSLLMSPDPRVVKMKVFWNNRKDSIETAVTPADIAKEKTISIPTINEGVYTFEVVTYDAKGKASITLQKTGSILGANYIDGLFNRIVKARIKVEGQPAVTWFKETDTTSIMVGVKVTYPLITGGTAELFTKRSRDSTILTNADPLGKMIIKTAYIPKLAIDTFYSKPDTLSY